jgi:hypothetical protein
LAPITVATPSIFVPSLDTEMQSYPTLTGYVYF